METTVGKVCFPLTVMTYYPQKMKFRFVLHKCLTGYFPVLQAADYYFEIT